MTITYGINMFYYSVSKITQGPVQHHNMPYASEKNFLKSYFWKKISSQ